MPDTLSIQPSALTQPPALGAAMPALPRTLPADVGQAQAAFQGILGRTMGHTLPAGASPEARARDAAEAAVAATFIQPILKQLRDSDHTPAPWGPGQAEKQFNALRDAELAQRLAHAQRFPLVDRMARDLLARSARTAAPNTQASTAITPPHHTHADQHTHTAD